LPEGLPLAIARRRLNLRIDQDRMVGQFRLFQRPADPEVPPWANGGTQQSAATCIVMAFSPPCCQTKPPASRARVHL
jgi:hypothetical protein